MRSHWSQEETDILKSMLAAENCVADISAVIGRSCSAVRSRAHYLGLQENNRRVRWTQNEIRVLEAYPDLQPRELLSLFAAMGYPRTEVSIRIKRWELHKVRRKAQRIELQNAINNIEEQEALHNYFWNY